VVNHVGYGVKEMANDLHVKEKETMA